MEKERDGNRPMRPSRGVRNREGAMARKQKKRRNPWREYERSKKKLQNQGMTSKEYEAAVQALSKKLKL